MNKVNKKCEKCGELLGESQYAKEKKESELSIKSGEDLVCINYPSCPKAEKVIPPKGV